MEELIDEQIGCGYCAFENICTDKDPNVNKAKLGCDNFIHFLKLEELTKKEE